MYLLGDGLHGPDPQMIKTEKNPGYDREHKQRIELILNLKSTVLLLALSLTPETMVFIP